MCATATKGSAFTVALPLSVKAVKEQPGHQPKQGELTIAEVRDEYTRYCAGSRITFSLSPVPADHFAPNEPFVLVFVGRSLDGDTADVYRAAPGGWKMRAGGGPPARYRELVLARDSDRVLGAFRPRRWYQDPNDGGRWYFDGEPTDAVYTATELYPS